MLVSLDGYCKLIHRHERVGRHKRYYSRRVFRSSIVHIVHNGGCCEPVPKLCGRMTRCARSWRRCRLAALSLVWPRDSSGEAARHSRLNNFLIKKMKKGVCHAHVAATLLILVALAGFFLALFYNPQKYLMEVKDEVIEDNFCNGTCNHTVVLTTNNALSIGDNFCANGGCPYATTVSFPSFNIKSIGNNYCANGCYAMRTFYSKTVTSIGDSFCNWGCD